MTLAAGDGSGPHWLPRLRKGNLRYREARMRKTKNRLITAALLCGACSAFAQPPLPQRAAPAAEAGEPADFAGMVEAHNHWRRQVGAPDLVWSPDAARRAQSWADELGENECQARHNPDPSRREMFGENIYFYWSSRPYDGYRRGPEAVVRAWGDERQWYDEERDQCTAPKGKTCRHYTQVVWSRSSVVGCGRARCESAEIWVCNYSPRGNFIGVRPYEPRDKPPQVRADARAAVPDAASPAGLLPQAAEPAPIPLPLDGPALPPADPAP